MQTSARFLPTTTGKQPMERPKMADSGRSSPIELRRRAARSRLYPNLDEFRDESDRDTEFESDIEAESYREVESDIEAESDREVESEVDRDGDPTEPVVANQAQESQEKKGSQFKKEAASSDDVVNKARDQTPKAAQWDSRNLLWSLLIIVAILVIILAIISTDGLAPKGSTNSQLPQLHYFKEKFAALESRFPSQSKHMWNAVEKLGSDHISLVHDERIPGPKRPLVFMFSSVLGNKDTLVCFAKEIGKTFASDSKHEPSVVYGNEVVKALNQKEALDDRLSSVLNSSSDHGVVIVTELDLLSFHVASIFFKYCDNEGAPYPNAVFIFTLSMDKMDSFLQKNRREMTRETRSYLSDVVWKDGEKAKKDALIARILDPFPFAVMGEESDVCSNPSDSSDF